VKSAPIALLLGLFTLMPALQPRVDAQLPAAPTIVSPASNGASSG
jgi:hypothetical protein